MKKFEKLIIALITFTCAFTTFADPTAKAVWNANENTFTFYYDENAYSGDGITQYAVPTANAWNTAPEWDGVSPAPKGSVTNAIFDVSFAAYKPVNLNSWFKDFSKLESVENLKYLDTSNAGYCTSMFSGCSSLTTLDLSNFVTTTMKFRNFFNGCSKIETLDLTSFTIVDDCRSMFAGMSKLKTIYVTEFFAWKEGTSDDSKTFNGCSSLVGGAGTAYATVQNKTKEYGRIDDPENGNPGYFTYGAKASPPAISGVAVSSVTHESVVINVTGDTLNDGVLTVELIAEGEAPVSKDHDDFGLFDFDGLAPETFYSVRVIAESAFGATTNETASFTTSAMPAAYWLYDASENTISWASWKFAATMEQGGTLSVGAVAEWPSAPGALDFSLPVKDASEETYVISKLNPQFGFQNKEDKYAPAGREPQCLRVGLLTLPSTGLVEIANCAFCRCQNATGNVVFPETLTTIGNCAFTDCSKLEIDGSTIPDGVTRIPQYCFRGATRMFGDVILLGVTAVDDSAFQETSISSVSFGSNLVSVGGNYKRGAFQDCTSLTNVVFDAASSVQIATCFTFAGCTALEELDLRGVVNVALSIDRDDYSHISGCNNLRKITFDAGLTNLTCNAIAGASALEKIVFEGLPPIGFQMPYLAAFDRDGVHVLGYDAQTVKTYVHCKLVDTQNAAGVCWADYAVSRKIAPEKKNLANNTTWASNYICEDVDPTLRPLLSLEPYVGFTIIVR